MPGNDLRLLALDGGGVRGLSALMILKQLTHGSCRPRRAAQAVRLLRHDRWDEHGRC
ncbi:hypothetical protein PMIN01_12184 [Paraphaeosphaeria minitans]|uniref:PNPLA domain-containing protein n=1 Tax=Paraphaeosphaeria minitans TaxID=565426 RepID=A0A9P6G6X3_9PLEO|nr:hypothetical protein PMIN01_12184 [Paraphaeosphaeria minitans]